VRREGLGEEKKERRGKKEGEECKGEGKGRRREGRKMKEK
jgi:hypothetical protein